MRGLVIGLGSGILAACSMPDTPHEPVDGPEEVALDPETATDPDAYVGTYHLVYSDGTEGDATFASGGKVSGEFGGQAISGDYAVPSAGKVCFDNVSTGEAPHCWLNGPADEHGAWAASMDDGVTLTVTPKH